MIFELKQIITQAHLAYLQGKQTVFVSVVALEGSSYRRPGVRMLIQKNGEMTGAVSGGCVEKEILRQSQSVFKTHNPKLMVYDGRYRLGCEGMLYILIEIFQPKTSFFTTFETQINNRSNFSIRSYFSKGEVNRLKGGSEFIFSDGSIFSISTFNKEEHLEVFTESITGQFQLIILGNEHDAVQLSLLASQLGWKVIIYAPNNDSKSIHNFPGASAYLTEHDITFSDLEMDAQTAVVLMSHSFAKDLKFLSELSLKKPAYIGLLGPKKRREQLIHKILELHPETDLNFFDNLYGPSGLNIGAESPQEIAIAIIAEILSTLRRQNPISLRDKVKGIHE